MPQSKWAALTSDHIVPGFFYAIVTIANVMVVRDVLAGTGLASGLDPVASGWLLVHRVLLTLWVALAALLFMIRRGRMGSQPGLMAALVGLMVSPRSLDLHRQVVQAFVPALVAVAGANALALQAFYPVTEKSTLFTVPGAALEAIGLLMALISLAYLGRCFGVLPEVRGLVTHGPYAIVRHPLYLAEIMASLGALLPTWSASTVAVFLLFVALQYRRALYEEKALVGIFPEYEAYARGTWRIVPGVH